MEEITSPTEVARAVEGTDNGVQFDGKTGSRIEFTYDSVVHAHMLPDEYRFVGFGENWFAITIA